MTSPVLDLPNMSKVIRSIRGQPSWISNRFKKIQHFLQEPLGNNCGTIFYWYAVVLMWKVYYLQTDGQTAGRHTLFVEKGSSKTLLSGVVDRALTYCLPPRIYVLVVHRIPHFHIHLLASRQLYMDDNASPHRSRIVNQYKPQKTINTILSSDRAYVW